jgi:hypothetical protein
LYNNEKQQTNSQQNWVDLPQTTKDEYIKRLPKLKNEYHEKFIEFVEKTLPSDYIRLEFFRNVKYASKDYESFTKDRINDNDEKQLKITQYLTPKKQDINEFDRIKQQLLATNLNNQQKKLVERLGQLMNKYIEETVSGIAREKRRSRDPRISGFGDPRIPRSQNLEIPGSNEIYRAPRISGFWDLRIPRYPNPEIPGSNEIHQNPGISKFAFSSLTFDIDFILDCIKEEFFQSEKLNRR